MAHIGKLPGFQRLITTHDAEGRAIFSDVVDTNASFDGSIEGGRVAFSLAYTTTEFPVDMKGGNDVAKYQDSLSNPPGIVQRTGSVLRVVDTAPGGTSPMHRTISLDYGVVLIGEVELILDSGEKRIMKTGDVCVQRGTMHAWRNTSNTEWARMIFVLQPSLPVEVGGQKLGEDYGTSSGIRAST